MQLYIWWYSFLFWICRFKGIGVKVGSGEVVITLLQMEGKNKMKALDFANGYGKDNLIGQILS